MGKLTLGGAIILTLGFTVVINLTIFVGHNLIPSVAVLLYLSEIDNNHTKLHIHDFQRGLSYVFLDELIGHGLSASWSPDGQYIVFSNYHQNKARRSIYIVDVDTEAVSQIGDSTYDYNTPAWSPDGRYIAYSGWFIHDSGWDIVLYDLETGQSQIIYAEDTDDTNPTWSPDGEFITFTSDTRIVTMNIQSLESEVIVDGLHRYAIADWSPDGETLIFTANRNVNFELYQMANDSITQLTQSAKNEHSPKWSPDGRYIAYEAWGYYNNSHIYVTDIDGHTIQVTHGNANYKQPDWRPKSP